MATKTVARLIKTIKALEEENEGLRSDYETLMNQFSKEHDKNLDDFVCPYCGQDKLQVVHCLTKYYKFEKGNETPLMRGYENQPHQLADFSHVECEGCKNKNVSKHYRILKHEKIVERQL